MGEKNILQDFVTVFAPVAEPGEPYQIYFCIVLFIPRGTLLLNLMILRQKKSVVPICTDEKCKLIQEHV